MTHHAPSSRFATRGLTLLELLLGMVVLSLIMIAISAAMATMQNTWVRTRQKADTFRSTRTALETMSRRIAQATLATRLVPNEPTSTNSNEPPMRPESDLHFVLGPIRGSHPLSVGNGGSGHAIFFQAPFGEIGDQRRSSGQAGNRSYDHLTDTMCSWGYFVKYDEDEAAMPKFLRSNDPDRLHHRKRFRLMEFRQPAEELSLYKVDDSGKAALAAASPPLLYSWFTDALTGPQPSMAVVAENVIAVLFSPFDPALSQTTTGDVREDIQPFLISKDGLYDTRRALWESTPMGGDDPEYIQRSLHHLPPGLRITVIATSEDSWLRLLARQGEGMVNAAAENVLSAINGRFQSPRTFKQDLQSVEAMLNEMKLDYRIFTTDIQMPEQ